MTDIKVRLLILLAKTALTKPLTASAEEDFVPFGASALFKMFYKNLQFSGVGQPCPGVGYRRWGSLFFPFRDSGKKSDHCSSGQPSWQRGVKDRPGLAPQRPRWRVSAHMEGLAWKVPRLAASHKASPLEKILESRGHTLSITSSGGPLKQDFGTSVFGEAG